MTPDGRLKGDGTEWVRVTSDLKHQARNFLKAIWWVVRLFALTLWVNGILGLLVLLGFGLLVLIFVGVPVLISGLGLPRDWVAIVTVILYIAVGYQIVKHWDVIKHWFGKRFPSKD